MVRWVGDTPLPSVSPGDKELHPRGALQCVDETSGDITPEVKEIESTARVALCEETEEVAEPKEQEKNENDQHGKQAPTQLPNDGRLHYVGRLPKPRLRPKLPLSEAPPFAEGTYPSRHHAKSCGTTSSRKMPKAP
ncbi:hypothetical protein NDU88_001078 [Pleurodeles waltl]|uniref:Uncharacterized protein n=1 Tax=Pleurodeles waltl TaxID=8319 RepID=A0AAV7W007_PLEWA|nr:hypothetical protein NDU88_001078 [Pleurodeles waltl]